ncbi:MAG: ferritin-like domain-containing protein [Nocardioidaceae bacterium]
MSEAMDTDQVYERLGQAINMQAESVLTMSILAGTMRGVGGAAIKQDLRSFVLAELEDTYRLVEKLSALGGTPTMTATDVSVSDDGDKALSALLDHEVKAVAALHAVIPHSGQEPRSEALEHMLEHVIMRKQQQIDYLWHAAEREEPLA